ncbi:MAG: hypothetical protein GY800_06700 [Planctomycetes bacterium]|nr:hypothetical protein [Planctomycetota bacterium]
MKINERYSSSVDANQQLSNTYVELDGELAHITAIDGWNYWVKKPIDALGGKRKWGIAAQTNIKECDLNLEPIKLGYMNYRGSAYYVQRKPLRKWKQGIYIDYLEMATPDKPQQHLNNGLVRRNGHAPPMMSNLFTTGSLIEMYDNDFPNFVRAFSEVNILGGESSAWSREWAFRKLVQHDGYGGMKHEISLDYKGKKVGEVQGGNVVIYHQFKYLTETFVEAMIHAS